jgi:ribosome biogenesis GTPase / thiamine phosphate phosphatase
MGLPGLTEGMIVKGVGGFYEVWLPDRGACIVCKAKGLFRREKIVPLAGDRVLVDADRSEPGQGFIESILPRRNVFVRPPVANMDQMVIVLTTAMPPPDLPLVDKLLIACELNDIRPLLVINKIDIAESGQVEDLKSNYAASGYPLAAVSCKTGEGVEALTVALAGSTAALAGQSGVGKSTLINVLSVASRMETGELSDKIQRGKHTTRHAELLPMPGNGWLCDTAGFSSYQLDSVDHEELDQFFPEFFPELEQCRYAGCSHLKEAGCAVQGKYEAGHIARSRFEAYARFYAELRERHANRYK